MDFLLTCWVCVCVCVAAANVSFTGEVYLHAFVGHQFSGQNATQLSLNARARQFSSFLVLVGRITGPGLFEPKYGIIVQNKDDIKLPLSLETIPTPKEFAHSISSLSPEQQRFAVAFRSMQLASTLFAVCVIQIKPQLERLLKLPFDSLTKEIAMTQDLLEMFIKYQIPSDLLSYGGDSERAEAAKVSEVKGHIKAMQDMIAASKEKELKEAAEVASYKVLDTIESGGEIGRVTGGKLVSTGKGAEGQLRSARNTQGAGQNNTAKQREAKPLPLGVVDYTRLPVELDGKFARLDEDSALRPTIINVGKQWNKRSKKGLLSDFANST